jgi:hypothetical protein
MTDGNKENASEKGNILQKGEFFHEFIAIFMEKGKNCRNLLLSKKSKIFIIFNGAY